MRIVLDSNIFVSALIMSSDFHPFHVRVGDSWTRIDCGKDAHD